MHVMLLQTVKKSVSKAMYDVEDEYLYMHPPPNSIIEQATPLHM